MSVCEFSSPLDVLDQATHYRCAEQDGERAISLIVRRERCPQCGRTAMLSMANGANATFTTRHWVCLKDRLHDRPPPRGGVPDGSHRTRH